MGFGGKWKLGRRRQALVVEKPGCEGNTVAGKNVCTNLRANTRGPYWEDTCCADSSSSSINCSSSSRSSNKKTETETRAINPNRLHAKAIKLYRKPLRRDDPWSAITMHLTTAGLLMLRSKSMRLRIILLFIVEQHRSKIACLRGHCCRQRSERRTRTDFSRDYTVREGRCA